MIFEPIEIIAQRLTFFGRPFSDGQKVSARPVKFRIAESLQATFNRVNLCVSVAK
jgi:hypothetical protein